MNCQQAQNLIEDAVDRRLSGKAKRNFDLHLARCKACRAFFAAEQREHTRWFRAFNGVAAPHEPLPADFADRLAAAVAAAPPRRRFFLRMPRWARIAASFAAVASLAAFGSWAAAAIGGSSGNAAAEEVVDAPVPVAEGVAEARSAFPAFPPPSETPAPAVGSGGQSPQFTPAKEDATMKKSTLAAAAVAVGATVLPTAAFQATADNTCIISGSTERPCASVAWDESGEFELDTRVPMCRHAAPMDSFDSRIAAVGFGSPFQKFRSDEPSGCVIIIR